MPQGEKTSCEEPCYLRKRALCGAHKERCSPPPTYKSDGLPVCSDNTKNDHVLCLQWQHGAGFLQRRSAVLDKLPRGVDPGRGNSCVQSRRQRNSHRSQSTQSARKVSECHLVGVNGFSLNFRLTAVTLHGLFEGIYHGGHLTPEIRILHISGVPVLRRLFHPKP